MTSSSGETPPPTNTPYTALARRYWTKHRPQAWAGLHDPETFITHLGQQIAGQVVTLTAQLQGPDRPGETYLEKVGRLSAARSQAEEIVLEDLLYSQPGEPETLIDHLEEMLADLPEAAMIRDRLTHLEHPDLVQHTMDGSQAPILSQEQHQQREHLRALLPLVTGPEPEMMSEEELTARVQALTPLWQAHRQIFPS